MVGGEKKHSIPETCKNYGCLRILELTVGERASKEENPEYADGLKTNLEGIATYLKFFNRQGIFITFPHQIRRHLDEIDFYFGTGVWKRIYPSEKVEEDNLIKST
jgi:hypothetical protein